LSDRKSQTQIKASQPTQSKHTIKPTTKSSHMDQIKQKKQVQQMQITWAD
jgi:hypothetical protein